MPLSRTVDPGFIAVSRDNSGFAMPELDQFLTRVVGEGRSLSQSGSVELHAWGIDVDGESTLLCRATRRRDDDLTRQALSVMLNAGRRQDLADVLPPFAALALDGERLVVATDLIGARHVYHRRGPGWAAVSTSLQALATCANSAIDREAIAVQSLLGWQLGSRTMLAETDKLDAGNALTLHAGSIDIERYVSLQAPDHIDLDTAVRRATTLLQRYLDTYLDEHPDAILQLTGGQDSRILLSAIEPSRRRGLRVVTLNVPGTEDVAIAAELAARCQLDHQVIALEGLANLSPEEAHRRCVMASRRLNYMADPLAMAALSHAESMIDQGPRLSGLGGEVARGFYYVGPMLPVPVVGPLASALAKWRLFSNEAVSEGVLTAEFAAWSREFTTAEVSRLLSAVDEPWWPATDEFYLFQRMQRWAGVTDSAICFDRAVTNPMLDRRFLDIARGMRPVDKRGALFLGRLQVALDPDLAATSTRWQAIT